MELTRLAFTDHSFRWQPHTRRDIGGRGERTAAFTPENRFGAGGKRGLRWSQRQAGLAVQPFFGLGFRLRWSGSAVERLSVFGYGIGCQGARFVRLGARFVRTGARFVRIFVRFVHEFRVIGADWQVFRHSLQFAGLCMWMWM